MSIVFLRKDVWYVKKIINGKTIYKSTKTSNKRDAERIAAKWIAEFHQQVVVDGKTSIKTHDAIDLYVKSKAHIQSIQNIEIHLRYFKALPNIEIDKITNAQIAELLSKKRAEGYAESTLKVSVGYFNTMLKMLDDQGYKIRKRLDSIKHNSQRLRWLTKQELQQLYAELDPAKGVDEVAVAQKQDNFDLVRLLYETGCRFSEIAELKFVHVNLDKGTVFIKRKKGSIDGTLRMTQTMREIFARRRQIKPGEEVFSTKNSRSNNKWINAAVARAKLDETDGSVSLHTLRHTRAVHLLQAGMNLLEVKTYLGHRSIQSTMVYAHVIEDDVMAKAVRLSDMQEAA